MFTFDDGSKHELTTGGLSLHQISQRLNQKRGMIDVLENWKNNPNRSKETEEIAAHFKNVEEKLGFGNVLWEIPTGKHLNDLPMEPATEEEISKYNLEERLGLIDPDA